MGVVLCIKSGDYTKVQKTKMDTRNDEFFSELDKSQEAARSTQTRLEDQDSTDDEHEVSTSFKD